MLKKNVIVLGSNKTGKSTLSKIISEKHGCEIQNTKNILKSLSKVYPTDSSVGYQSFETEFLIDYINRLSSGPDFIMSKKNVIEINTTNVDEILSNIDMERNSIIGLSYGEISVDELFKNIKSTEGEFDLTHFLSDETLKNMITEYLEKDKELVKIYEKHNIKNFVTSNDRENVLENINEILSSKPNMLVLK